jgi:anaphase-promoting complex subunit 5
MSRYLTPSKLGLLALVSLYCDAVVPNRAIIPILSFIVSHISRTTNPNSDAPASATVFDPVASIAEFEKVTAAHPSGVPGRSLLDLFLKRLWSINCLDALHDFFHGLNERLERTQEQIRADGVGAVPTRPTGRILLSRVSPLGIFVRRAQLEFTRMQFHDTVNLWTAFVSFRSPTEAAWKKRNPTASAILDASLADLGSEQSLKLLHACYGVDEAGSGDALIYSSEDIERVLEFHLDRLQRKVEQLHYFIALG